LTGSGRWCQCPGRARALASIELDEEQAVAKGHPKGLYRLFFTEMWERLAFYTMLNVLLLYATDFERGGLGLTSAEGNEIYGLYLAFVYFTPFPGGMLADRYLGYRKAVLIGAVFMAAGLFLMSVPGQTYFVVGLVSLIVGNGFFKPNISVMVGNLYPPGDPKRDAGFNIFYMGINIGAFVASFLSAAVRNANITFMGMLVGGWLWTFRVAGFGLVIAMVILLLSWKTLEKADRPPELGPDDTGFGTIFAKILLPALIVGGLVGWLAHQELIPHGPVRPAVMGFLAGMVPVIIFFIRLPGSAKKEERPGLKALLPIYVAGGTFFMILHLNGSAMTQWARDDTDRYMGGQERSAVEQDALPKYYLNAAQDVPRPDPRSLLVAPSDEAARMFGQQRLDEATVERIAASNPDITVREIPEGAKDLPEQIVERSAKVYATGTVTISEGDDGHGGKTISVSIPDRATPLRQVAFVREVEGTSVATYLVDEALFEELYGGYEARFGRPPDLLPPGRFLPVINPELYQSLNALFVIAFTPMVVWFFALMTRRKRAVSTARKLFYGLVLTTLSLLLMAVAGLLTEGGTLKVSGLWLGGFYAIVTLGELLLSPMGLSLVTKLTPKRMAGLAMGGWFIASAFGNNLSGFFGGIQGMLSPVDFFLLLAGLAGMSALFIRALLPFLERTLEKYGA
jgi:amino acid/peptide:H+ symporter